MSPQEKKKSLFDSMYDLEDILSCPDPDFLFYPFLTAKGSWCVVSVTTYEEIQWFTETLSQSAHTLGLTLSPDLSSGGILSLDLTDQGGLDILALDSRIQTFYEGDCPTRVYFVSDLEEQNLWQADLVLGLTNDLVYVEKVREAPLPSGPIPREEWMDFYGPRSS